MIRRGFKYFILVCLCLLGFSCTLQNRYGEIALALPENGLSSGRTAARGVDELPLGDTYPDIYTIKVTPNSGDRILVEGKAGQNIVIANLMPGDYEVIVEGEKSGFLFHGKTNVVVESGKTTEARLELYKSEIKGEGGVPGVTIDEAISLIEASNGDPVKLNISDTYNVDKLTQLAAKITPRLGSQTVELDLSDYKNMTEVPVELFLNAGALIKIVLPDTVTNIGDSAFYGCSNLSSINLNNIVTLAGSALQSTGINNINLASTKSIGDSCFNNCASLTNITLGNSLESIGVQAFMNCILLETVTIPASVTKISKKAFQGCNGLTSVIFTNTTLTWGLLDNSSRDTYIVNEHTPTDNAVALTETYLEKTWMISK